MKINKLRYKDNVQKWELQEIDFFDLTLLVGISGVGKTQILSAILNLKNIVSGKSLNGVEWDVSFSNGDNIYKWNGEFEAIEQTVVMGELGDGRKEIKAKLIKENIKLDDELIAKRENNEIFFQGIKMPKLASEKSLLSIFKEEDKIKSAFEGFKKIIFRDHTQKEDLTYFWDYKKNKEQFKTIQEIRNSGLDTIAKLFCLYENQKKYFEEISDSYKDVFPQVEAIKVEPVGNKSFAFLGKIPVIQFKEKGVEKWITQDSMSSGMLRTFLHISEMYLLADGTVVLIDEFENSLGVNCIDVLTEDLIFEHSRIQFIATSHHPYIINKIPYDYWKIVTRKGGVIKTFDAKSFELGDSNHERFMSLINLPQYKGGIESFS